MLMSHWLDVEERMHSPVNKGRADSTSSKRGEIERNFALVSAKYNDFLDDLYNLIDRVNSLPVESRSDFGAIEGKDKDTKLNNHLNIFSSSRRKYKVSILDYLRFFSKRKKYKNFRVVYFNVSSRQGMIDIEVKERTVQRFSHASDKVESDDDRHVSRQVHIVEYLPVEMLDHDFALGVIDWLAFKQDSEHSEVIGKLKQYGLRKK